jgi:hypothetical protein
MPAVKPSRVLAAIGVVAFPLLSFTAQAFDYPTVDRVEYVHICQRDNSDRPAQEMLYKCSCVIDAIAEKMSYDDYVESSTAFYASSIAGERGQVIRNESHAKQLAGAFRSLQSSAKKNCFIN